MKKYLLTLLTWISLAFAAHAATTINAVNKHSYGANIGWIDWRGDVANGAVIGAFVCPAPSTQPTSAGYLSATAHRPTVSVMGTISPRTVA